MILVDLRGCGEWRKLKYCKERASWPIVDLNRVPMCVEDATFDDLQK